MAAQAPGAEGQASAHYVYCPGRVCLFGEHSDWAGGMRRFSPDIPVGRTIVCGTNVGIHARARALPTLLTVQSTDETGGKHGPFSVPMEPVALLAAAREGTFFSYAAGVAYHMLTHYRVGGLDIDNFQTDLPLKKGLSSSAAFCVLVVRAFDRVYNLRLTVRGEMECAFAGERLTPSKCGRMDQACANGSRPVAMTYDADFLDVEPISVSEPLYLVLVDLRAQKSTVRILNALQGCYPVATTAEHRNVHHALGLGNLDITSRALAAMEAGDARELGAIMDESHVLFTEAGSAVCPEELRAPVLQSVLSNPLIRPLVWGGKGVGAGGDGTAQFVCKSLSAQQQVVHLVETELKMFPIPLTIEPSTTVRSAVVPVAGFASSLFPATKVVSPPLFPICDRDGVTKPAILIIVEELCAAGFDKIVLVCQPGDEAIYRSLFKDPVSMGNFHRLTAGQQQKAKQMQEMGERVFVVVQDTQQGFSHAVLCARSILASDRFLVVLGDHLYLSQSPDGRSCVQQVVDASKQLCKDGASLLGLSLTDVRHVHRYGTVAGTWIRETGGDAMAHTASAQTQSAGPRAAAHAPAHTHTPSSALNLTTFVEKPSEEETQRLAEGMVDMPEGKLLTVFGLYLINDPANLWRIIEEQLANNIRDPSGDFSFTAALNQLMEISGLRGMLVDGRRVDLGVSSSIPHIESMS